MLQQKKLSILILILISSSVSSQIRLGILASGNYTSLSGDTPPKASYASDIGYGLGATFDYYITSDIVLNLQGMFLDKSTKLQYDVDYQYDKIDSLKLLTKYLEFPVNVKVIANNYFSYVKAGISFAFPLSAQLKNVRTDKKYDLKDYLGDINIAVNFSAGIQFHIGVPIMIVELRYSQSLTNLGKRDLAENFIDEKVKSNSWLLYTGLLFTL